MAAPRPPANSRVPKVAPTKPTPKKVTPPTKTVQSPVPSLKLPGATDVKVGGNHIGTVNVSALRKFLISKGYDLPKTNSGTMGQRLAAAINDFGPTKLPKQYGSVNAVQTLLQQKYHWHTDADTGRQKPKLFNPTLGATSKVAPPITKVLGKGANVTPAVRAAGGNYDPNILTAGADALSSQAPLDEALSKQGAQPFGDPNGMADALAGLQYDSQIRDLANQRDVNVRQTDQNVHDIGSWYDQALASMKTATDRDAAITTAGKTSVKNADAAILASLGGDASGGASTVASAESANEGTLGALGTAQDQYNADVSPIVSQERAGQLTGERAAGTKRALDLAVQLASAKSDRGGSVASHLMDIREYNNTIKDNQLQRLLQIKGTNQAQDQQNFQNTLAVQQANLAALATGAKIAALRPGGKPVKGSFADTPASVKSLVAKNAYSALAGLGANDGALAHARVTAALRNAGWNPANPAVSQFAQGIIGGWQSSLG